MKAGQLDRRITIQQPTVTVSDGGQENITWTDVATVWARKVEHGGGERFAQQQQTGHAVKTFVIRWADWARDITVEYRIAFDGRHYDITDVRELGRREGLELDAWTPAETAVAPPRT